MAKATREPVSLARYVPRLSAEWELASSAPWREVQGTLCYVDISGFTALSEKLARFGRIGAEELTDVLNHVFGQMLSLAYERGGSLLKFGGDALLLLFQSADSASQACSAAVEMQAALRDAASVRTSVGRLRLRMSVGIHTGAVHMFRVGASHRELILTGPAASVTAEMEATADAGEIVVSSATKHMLPVGAAPVAKGNGWLLRWRKSRAELPGWTQRAAVPPEAIAIGLSVALRTFLQSGETEPEHHIATVGFVKFQGTDELMATLGPEAVADALDALIRAVQDAADTEGVTFLATDIDPDGGKIILVAGVPGAQEDDEGRLLRVARAINDYGGSLTLKIGINQGHVFTGDIGTSFRATYTVMGDTVNLAARLMAAASPGQVLATPTVLDQSYTLFETTALEPFNVKGKAQPVQAYLVGNAIGSRLVDHTGELPFVGRTTELDELTTAITRLRTTQAGAGCAITVIGETGIGKSRMVEEALECVGDTLVLQVRAEPYGATSPYRPVHEMLRLVVGVERAPPMAMAAQLTARVADLAPRLLAMLPLIADAMMIDVSPTPEADAIDPEFRQDRTADAIVALLAAACPGPIVLVIEDAHWMDDASTVLLERVVATTAERPWMVVTTRRDEPGGFHPRTRTLRLHPLDDERARQLVIRATEAAPLRPHDVEAIVRRAGGLPLFLAEVVRTVRETRSAATLPDSLGAVVSAQIDGLEPFARRLLRFASVLGRSFRTDVLRQLIVDDSIKLDAATRRRLTGFIESDGPGRLRFRHAIFRDAAYEGLSFKRRRELHLRAGDVEERAAGTDLDGAADVLALHFSLAHDHDRAWRYARIAGDQARDAYANVNAAAHYERALVAARRLEAVSDDDRADVYKSLGDVLERAGLFEESLDAYKRALGYVHDEPTRRIDLILRRSLVRRRSGAYVAALREVSQGLQLIDADASDQTIRLRGRLTAERGAIRSCQQRPREALRHAEQAEADARAVNDVETLGHALDLIDWAHRMMGSTNESVHYREALEIFERLGDLTGIAQVWNNLGADAFWEGRWDDAIDAYTKSQQAELRTGNDVQAAISAANIAELYIDQGRLEDAEPLLRDAIRVLTASSHAPATTFAQGELARLLIRRGDYDDGEALLSEIRARAVAAGESINVLTVAAHLADSKLRQGDGSSCLRILDDAERDARDSVALLGPMLARLRGGALAKLQRFDEAKSELDRGLTQARQQGLLYEQALLLDAMNAVAESAGSETDPDDVAEAGRLFDEMHIHRREVAHLL